MAVGERRNYQYPDPTIFPFVAALTSVIQPQQSASKSYSGYGTNIDEQTVPQGYRQAKPESYKDNMQNNYLMNDHLPWNSSTYPLNHNVVAYPLAMTQPGMNDANMPIQGTDVTLTRQASFPYGSLDQYLDNSGFNYDQFDNLDLSGYDYTGNFSLEDYADLEKVEEAETEINFDATVKQEKPKNDEGIKNLQKMESVMNTSMLNGKSDNDWAPNAFNDYPDNVVVAPVAGNDQSLAELDKLIDILHDDFYPTPNSEEWSTQHESLASENQPSTVSEQIIVKTEPGEFGQKSCDLTLQQIVKNASSSLPVNDEEVIQMPVSRFNELLVSLNQEQSNLAKDIRRRGKNKEAARLCRKRKLDDISTLEGSVTSLNTEKSRLLEERKQIISETEELQRNIDCIYKILMKGLNDKNLSSSSDFSILHYSEGNTFLFKK